MQGNPQSPGALNWFLVILLGFIWGGAFFSTKLALDGFGPMTVATGRVLIAALLLLAAAEIMGQSVRGIRNLTVWMHVVAFALISVVGALLLLAWGLDQVSSAFAGVAMGAVPLLVLPLAAAFSPGETIGPFRIAGVCLGFVGLVILIGPDRILSGDGSIAGRLACIATAACYAVGSIITRRCPPVQPIAFAAATLALGAVVMVPVALLADGMPGAVWNLPGAALAWAAVGPTALAAVLRVFVIRSAGSVFMSMTSYMVPVWAVILGAVVMGESIDRQMGLGLALILAGIGVAGARRKSRATAKG